jgi:hypothetical protein
VLVKTVLLRHFQCASESAQICVVLNSASSAGKKISNGSLKTKTEKPKTVLKHGENRVFYFTGRLPTACILLKDAADFSPFLYNLLSINKMRPAFLSANSIFG